jgi:tetratricopeptide (TPR) repeat protein
MTSRQLLTLLVAGLLLLGLVGSPSAAPNDRQICQEEQPARRADDVKDWDAIIAACSRLISSRTLRGAQLADAYWVRAKQYDERREYDRALADYSEAIKLSPKNSTYLFYRAMIYRYNKGDPDRAIADLSEAIRLEKSETYLALRGEIYELKDQPEKALADYRAALSANPSYQTAREDLERLEAKMAAPPPAPAAPAAAAAAAKPATVAAAPAAATDSSDCTAQFYTAAKDPAARLAACTRVIESSESGEYERSTAYAQRGLTFRQTGEFERAIADYDEALRIYPTFAGPHVLRASVLLDLGQTERAIADWDAVIRSHSDDIASTPSSNLYWLRGLSYLSKGELDRAIADFSEGIRLYPDDIFKFLYSRSRAHLFKGELEQAHADATQAVALPPGRIAGATVTALVTRAMVYEWAGQLDDAMTDLNEAIKADPKLGLAYAYRGHVREAKGEREQAQTDLAAAMQHNPAVVWGYVYLGNVLEMSGRMDRALIEYETALKLDPKTLAAAKGRDRVRAALAAAGK